MNFNDPVMRARLHALAAQQETGEGRPLQELLSSNDPLKGVESQRLRTYFTSNTMEPGRDLDSYGRSIMLGDISGIKADFASRVSRLSQAESEENARAAAAQELARCRWGPTRVPIFNLILLSSLIVPNLRPDHLEIARWLISEAKAPVDGTDLSGSQAIYHAISTKPAFDAEYAQILYDAGGDVNHRNRYGGTAAHEIALIWDYKNKQVSRVAADALEWFLTHGGNIDIKDNDGQTARQCVDNTRRLVSMQGPTNLKLPIWDVVRKEDERRKKLGLKVCAFCGRGPEEEKVLLVCSRCRKAAYCSPSRKCQKADWPRHKVECNLHKA